MPPQPQAMLVQAMRDFQAVRGFRVTQGARFGSDLRFAAPFALEQ